MTICATCDHWRRDPDIPDIGRCSAGSTGTSYGFGCRSWARVAPRPDIADGRDEPTEARP